MNCIPRVLGLRRDAKYLNPKGRLSYREGFIIELVKSPST